MIGHTDAYTASAILVSGPPPIITSAAGMSATDGIGRSNSTIALVATRRPGMLPSSNPAGTAMAIAMISAINQASTVATMSLMNNSSPSSSTSRDSTVL